MQSLLKAGPRPLPYSVLDYARLAGSKFPDSAVSIALPGTHIFLDIKGWRGKEKG